MNRIILIQMPFFTVHTPSISIEILKSELNRNGFNCDIAYYNIEFAQKIGIDLYTIISEHLPQELLLGDIIFTPTLYGKKITKRYIVNLISKLKGSGAARKVPEHLLESITAISEAAKEFVFDKIKQVDWSQYILVGFSTIFNTIPALSLANEIKKINSHPPVIFGGSSCEAEMGEYLHRCFHNIDYVCRGEGEALIVNLAKHLIGDNVKLEEIVGLIWRKDNETIINGQRTKIINNLDDTPIPSFKEWTNKIMSIGAINDSRLRLPIETSRGCWYGAKCQCRFCGLNGEAIVYRSKSSKRVLCEFEILLQHNDIKSISAVDNILDSKYFKTVIPKLSIINGTSSIFYEVKSNLTYDQLVNLKAAGITRIQPGIESLNTETLRLMRKGVTALQNIRLIKWASELGIIVAWNILYGFPGEEKNNYYDMIKLISHIAHLQPPIICTPMRLDRFSPFYNNRKKFGLKEVRPFPSYFEIYPFDDKSINHLAYFFEHEYDSHPNLHEWEIKLHDSVESWKLDAGNSSFTCIDRGNILYIFDSRSIAFQSKLLLTGIERDIFNACHEGRSLNDLCKSLEQSPRKISSILENFIERNLVVKLDDKYVCLAVRMNNHIPNDVHPAILEPITQNVYRSFLKGQFDSLKGATDSKPYSIS